MAVKKRSKSTIKPKRSIERGIEKGVEKKRKANKPRVMKPKWISLVDGTSRPYMATDEGHSRLDKKSSKRNPFTKASGRGSMDEGRHSVGPIRWKGYGRKLAAQAIKDEETRRSRRKATKTRTKSLSTASKLANLGIKKPGRK